MDPKVVLITGCSSGIGRAAAAALLDAGHSVVATARNPADLIELAGDRLTTRALDVTKDASMRNAVAATVKEHGRIDALVNNAGYGLMLPLEEMPTAGLRAMFEVNVFGAQRLTQLVLPHMRAQAPGPGGIRGRIVNVTSGAAQVAIPMQSGYAATKHALHAMTWSLHNEVKGLGIHACTIEPGRIATRFGHSSVAASRAADGVDSWPRTEGSPYEWLHNKWDDVRFNAKGVPPDGVARAIRHAATARRPRFRYVTPLDAKAGSWARRLMPAAVLNAGIRAFFRFGQRP